MNTLPEFFLWAFVLNLGVAYGAGLYEHALVVPRWFSRTPGVPGLRVHPEVMRQTDSGRRFWAFVTTGPLTLLTIVNLVLAWQSDGTRHDWWLAAALTVLLERLGTFTFFIPTALRLMRSDEVPVATASRLAVRWVQLNYVREALTLAGWLLALRALTLPG
jgi:hypothetical protein